MGFGKSFGKTIVLLILVIILILGGLLWFDYLGVVHAKSLFAPIYKLFGLAPQTSTPVTQNDPSLMSNLDDDRLAKRLESLEIRAQELDKREEDLRSECPKLVIDIDSQNAKLNDTVLDLNPPKEDVKTVCEECKAGKRGCVACKKQLAKNIIEELRPIREKRAYYEAHPEEVDKILMKGTEKARAVAKETMKKVKKAMMLDY